MSNTKQQFYKGDHVHVSANLGATMAHFDSDVDAIVIGSYSDQYGGTDFDLYTLHIKGMGQVSWYYASQLSLIEAGRNDLLAAWESQQRTEHDQKSDLDWIFAHGPEVVRSPQDATVESLARCMGITNLWGSSGEGFVYFMNCLNVMAAAKTFLMSGDKHGWLAFTNEAKRMEKTTPPTTKS